MANSIAEDVLREELPTVAWVKCRASNCSLIFRFIPIYKHHSQPYSEKPLCSERWWIQRLTAARGAESKWLLNTEPETGESYRRPGRLNEREWKKMKNQQLWRRGSAVKCSTLSMTHPLGSASHSSRAGLYLVSRVLGPSSGKLEPGRGSRGPTPPYLTVSYWYIMEQKQSLSLSSDVFPQVRASGSYRQFQTIVTRPWLNLIDKKTKDINVRREGI